MDLKYRLQLTVDGTEIDHEAIYQIFALTFRGDGLEIVGDSSRITLTYLSNEPWRVLEFCASFGEMHDITIVNLHTETN